MAIHTLGRFALIGALFVISLFWTGSQPVFALDIPKEAVLYYAQGCLGCAKVEGYLSEASQEIIKKDIYASSVIADEFTRFSESCGIPLTERSVPLLVTADHCILGDESIIKALENNDFSGGYKRSGNAKDSIVFGKVTVRVVIGGALVDAINPCAFAVLIILITTLLISGQKKKAIFSGLTFSAAIFISYFLMGLGLYSVIATFDISIIFMQVIAVGAILLGLLNLRDYFWYGRRAPIEVPISRRPAMIKLLRKVTHPIGAFLTGLLVSLFLLPCTSGPYVVILAMLGSGSTYHTALRYLLLYNIIFISPMILLTVGARYGRNLEYLEEVRKDHLHTLHLIAGILLLVIGGVLFYYAFF